MLPIVHRISDYIEGMIVTCKKHLPNYQLNSVEEDEPEEGRIKKCKEYDLDSHSDGEVESNKVD